MQYVNKHILWYVSTRLEFFWINSTKRFGGVWWQKWRKIVITTCRRTHTLPHPLNDKRHVQLYSKNYCAHIFMTHHIFTCLWNSTLTSRQKFRKASIIFGQFSTTRSRVGHDVHMVLMDSAWCGRRDYLCRAVVADMCVPSTRTVRTSDAGTTVSDWPMIIWRRGRW